MNMSMSDRLIEFLAREFEKRGFTLRRRATLEGMSNIKYYFDLIIEDQRGGRIIFSLAPKIKLEDVLVILATRMDLNTPHVIIADDIDPQAQELLKELNIFTASFGRNRLSIIADLPGSEVESLAKEILDILASFLSAKKVLS